jgi:hypothetical protein
MKKILIVNARTEWIDRGDILMTDAVICFDPKGVRHLVLHHHTEGYWWVINCDTGRTVTHKGIPVSIGKFENFFEGVGKELFNGWKFYKLEHEKVEPMPDDFPPYFKD